MKRRYLALIVVLLLGLVFWISNAMKCYGQDLQQDFLLNSIESMSSFDYPGADRLILETGSNLALVEEVASILSEKYQIQVVVRKPNSGIYAFWVIQIMEWDCECVRLRLIYGKEDTRWALAELFWEDGRREIHEINYLGAEDSRN